MKRYAIIRNANTRKEVEAYLPDRYTVIHEAVERDGQFNSTVPGGFEITGERRVYVIGGEDYLGWNLDEYILPRLASGTIFGEEIDLSHPIMKEIPV